jgi:endo-alpha-N-acetylgalactosaminidase
MLKRVIAVAVVVVGAFAAPASAQEYPPAQDSLALSDACVPAGSELTVTAGTFNPGATVTVTLGGAPLGTPAADGGGVATLTATVPAETAAGDVELTATGDGPSGPLALTARLTVDPEDCAAAPAPAAPGEGESAGGTLPRTGSDTLPLLRIGLALAAVGGLLLAATAKRRRAAAHARAVHLPS